MQAGVKLSSPLRETGTYVKYEGVLTFFKQDKVKADIFVAKRRGEFKGTSTCRNSGEELFPGCVEADAAGNVLALRRAEA